MKKVTKKAMISLVCVICLCLITTISVFAIQLGSGVSGTANGVTCYGWLYRHLPSTNDISSEACSDSTAYLLKSRVYYTEYSTPNPSTIPYGNLASAYSKVSSGYSKYSGSSNPTHVKGWNKVYVTSSVSWQDTCDYTFSNHIYVSPCKLCNTTVGENP